MNRANAIGMTETGSSYFRLRTSSRDSCFAVDGPKPENSAGIVWESPRLTFLFAFVTLVRRWVFCDAYRACSMAWEFLHRGHLSRRLFVIDLVHRGSTAVDDLLTTHRFYRMWRHKSPTCESKLFIRIPRTVMQSKAPEPDDYFQCQLHGSDVAFLTSLTSQGIDNVINHSPHDERRPDEIPGHQRNSLLYLAIASKFHAYSKYHNWPIATCYKLTSSVALTNAISLHYLAWKCNDLERRLFADYRGISLPSVSAMSHNQAYSSIFFCKYDSANCYNAESKRLTRGNVVKWYLSNFLHEHPASVVGYPWNQTPCAVLLRLMNARLSYSYLGGQIQLKAGWVSET